MVVCTKSCQVWPNRQVLIVIHKILYFQISKNDAFSGNAIVSATLFVKLDENAKKM